MCKNAGGVCGGSLLHFVLVALVLDADSMCSRQKCNIAFACASQRSQGWQTCRDTSGLWPLFLTDDRR